MQTEHSHTSLFFRVTVQYTVINRKLYGPRNMKRGCRRIHILLALIYVSHVQSLDIDSAVCRCAKKSKFGKPFVVLWNAPTEGCHINFSVNIELEKYGILTNSNQTWDGEVVTVFYNGQLGLYPFYRHDDEKMKYNAGLPQVRQASLRVHYLRQVLYIFDGIMVVKIIPNDAHYRLYISSGSLNPDSMEILKT